MIHYKALIILSVILAVLAFVAGPGWWLYDVKFYSSNDIPNGSVVSATIWIGWAWIAVFVAAVWIRGWRALWLLLGAPFVLLWPSLWIFVARACSVIGNCS